MLKRPRPGEEEWDLLNLQQQFLSQSSNKQKPSASVIRVGKRRETNWHQSSKEVSPQIGCLHFVIGDVVEKHHNDVATSLQFSTVSDLSTSQTTENLSGFPNVDKIDSESLKNEQPLKQKKKMSIFAQKMAAKKGLKVDENPPFTTIERELLPNESIELKKKANKSVQFDEHVDFSSIHEENVIKIKNMSEEEILSEQQQLTARLGSSTIDFLTKRSKHSKTTSTAANIALQQCSTKDAMECSSQDKIPPFESSVSHDATEAPANDQYIWESDLPDPDPTKTYSVRFDFKGLVVEEKQLPVHLGLHHHGDEQEVPGYSVEELFLLSKSLNVQQKVLAVKTLGLICRNSKQGYFVGLEVNVFQHLLDQGLPILLRLMLDQSNMSLVCTTVRAIKDMLINVNTQNLLEVQKSCFSTRLRFETSIATEKKLTSDQKPEDFMQKDLIGGLMGTCLIQRFRYILEVLCPPTEVCCDIVVVLVCLCQHSPSVAYSVFKCPRLIDFLLKEYVCLNKMLTDCTVETLNLLSSMAGCGVNMSKSLISSQIVEKCLLFCLADDDLLSVESSMNKQLTLRVVSAACFLAQIMLSYDLFCDELRSILPAVLMRTTRFQIIDLKKCSINELNFLISHFSFCVSLSARLIKSEEDTLDSELSFLHDLKSLAIILFNSWMVVCSKEDAIDYINSLHISVLSCLLRLVLVLFDLKESSSLKFNDVSLNVPNIITFLNNSALVTNKGLSSLMMKWPYEFTNSPSLVEPYYFLEGKSSTFSLFDFVSTVFDLCERKILDVKIINVTTFINKVLLCYSQYEAPVPRNKRFLNSYGYHMWQIVVQAMYKILMWVKSYLYSNEAAIHFNFIGVAFKLICECPHGCSELLKCLFWEIIFDPIFYKGVHVQDKFSQLTIHETKSWSSSLLCHEELNEIKSGYLATFGGKLLEVVPCSQKCISLLSHNPPAMSNSSPVMPSDWLFQPILDILTLKSSSKSSNLTGDRVMMQQQSESCCYLTLKNVTSCLKFTCILQNEECLRQEVLSHDLLFARLMCVFMLTPDIFKDQCVQQLMTKLFRILVNNDKITLNNDCDGLQSFQDHYVSLLEHFEAESFGDEVFANFVLLPMCTRFDVRYRRAVWIEFSNVFKVLRMGLDKLLFPFEWLIFPPETDEGILKAQKNCLQGDILSKCPILLQVAAAQNKIHADN